ncbi:MAG TPA: hypothetical protein PK020_13125 [Ilumatobacteraceae bacterium]|nr:hypothetical protein [Ilumatobacteraceae bacterium]HRB03105.1 hypothetical protein [Ilumatobacteraceae bacterium]
MKLLLPAVLLLSSLSACGGSEGTASTVAPTEPSAATTQAPAATDAPTTTEAATTLPTTTEAATTTTLKPSLVSGVVWASVVDPSRINQTTPIPSQTSASGVTVRLQLALYGPLKGAGTFSSECADEYEAELYADCLVVQLAMDVDPAFRVDGNSPDASMSVDAVITPEGKQLDSIWSESGYPGTKDTVLAVALPGATPGSTVKVSVGSNLVGYEILTFVLPPEFLPTPWVK